MLNKLQQKQRTSSKTKSKKQVWDSWGVAVWAAQAAHLKLIDYPIDGGIPLIVEVEDVTMFESTFGGPHRPYDAILQ